MTSHQLFYRLSGVFLGLTRPDLFAKLANVGITTDPTTCLIMKTARRSVCVSVLFNCVFVVMANAQTTIENFEYGSNADLLSAWTPQSATLTLSSYVSPKSTGTKSMRVDRYFPASAWETEILTGPTRPTPLVIATTQHLSLRISGDPQFTNANWQRFYLYTFDGDGNFGRWGTSFPTTTNWQVFNFPVSVVEKPSESPALPDFSNIVQFKFYLCGQGDPASVAYSATIYLDDLRILPAPVLTVVQQGTKLQLLMNNLIPGTTYTIQQTTNIAHPVTVKYTFPANSTSQTWPIPSGQKGFYQLYYAP